MHISVSGGARGGGSVCQVTIQAYSGSRRKENRGNGVEVKADGAGNVSARDALIELLPS